MNRNQAQVSLPFVLLVGGIIVEIALAGVFAAYFLSAASLGERLSERASSTAYSGIEDAMVQIAANKEFGGKTYTLPINGETAEVTTTQGDAPGGNAYLYTIESRASVGNRRKKFKAILVVDKTTGRSSLQSLEEVRAF